jgi:hypothetical protein
MKSFTYNDMEFSVEKAQDRWDISCKKADGKAALVAAGCSRDWPRAKPKRRPRHWCGPCFRSASGASVRTSRIPP